jgi:hypothetical protein
MIFKRSFPVSRRSRRQWINTSVQVFAGPNHMDALGINLSDGGMCFFTVANLHVGSRVDVEFLPPHTEAPVRMSGKIRHRALYLYGVEFLAQQTSAATQDARAVAAQLSRT